MWELDCEESWVPKNWCFWTVVLEKTLESPLDCKEIQSVYPKGDQSWVFIGRTDVEAETPILWPPDGKNWLLGKDPDAGKDWRREKTLMLGKTEGGKRRGQQRLRWLDGITDSMDMSLSKLWELAMDRKSGVLQSMGSQRVGHNWVTELKANQTRKFIIKHIEKQNPWNTLTTWQRSQFPSIWDQSGTWRWPHAILRSVTSGLSGTASRAKPALCPRPPALSLALFTPSPSTCE